MRRSTEKVIAVQLLTLIVAVSGLLISQLLGDSRSAQSPANALSLHGIAASSASPWRSLTRRIRRVFARGSHARGTTVAAEPPVTTPENTRAP